MPKKNKPRNYWKNKDNVVAEVKKIMAERNLSEVPTRRQLVKWGYSSLACAIGENYGFPEFRVLMGGEQLRKENGYWVNKDNIITEMKKIMAERNLSEVPTSRQLVEWGCSSLAYAIQDYYGFPEFRVLMGGEQLRKEKGYWSNKDNVVAEMRKVMVEYGVSVVPSRPRLKEWGCYSLLWAIDKHYGFPEFRILMGEGQLIKEKGYWCNKDNVVVEMQKVMGERNLSEVPTPRQLEEWGCSSLVRAIRDHYGFPEFRILMGGEQLKKKNNYWKDIGNVVVEMRKVMTEHNLSEVPSRPQLEEWGCYGLSSAIGTYYGFPVFREYMRKLDGQKSERQKLEDLLDGLTGDAE